MPSLQEILRDPNYISANPATKQAIFERWAPQDKNYTGANDATKQAIRQRFGVGVAAEPEMDQPKDEGFFTNVGKLALEGGERAIGAAKVSPSVISGNVGKEQAKGIAEQLAMKPTVQPKELTEVTTAFRDEAEALKKAQGFKESVVPTLQFMGEFGKQALTNPKGIAYLTAQSAANMAPSILGMIALGKAGAAAGTVVAPGPGTAIGGVGGAMLGGFSGGAPIEIGAQFIENVGKELSARGMEPTQENVEALLSDKKFVDKAVSEARTKGTTTAAVDAVMTAGAGRYATGPRRAAIKAAQTEMGVAADAAAVAKRAEEILKQGTKAERAVRAVKRGAGAVGIDVAGGGLSEAAGQYAAFGEVDPESVALEMLGELGGSAIEVPSAAYATGRDALKAKAKTDAAKILEEQAEQQRLAAERSAEEERMRPIREAEARVPAEEPVGPSITRTGRAALLGGAEPMTSTDPLAAAISARRQEREDAEVERERRARVEIPGAEEPTFNILRGLEARNQGLMSTLEARRTAAEEQAEVTRQERESKAAAERADADRRMSQVENFLLSPARKTQQETADYIAGVVPEMRKDFLALLDEDLNQPLTPEQTEALKTQIRQRLMPEAAPEPEAGRTRFKRFLATMGINKQDASDIFGDNAFRANQRLPGAIRADAPRLDMLAEAAVEAGFLQTEDPDVLAQMIKDEFFGVEQVPLDMAEERAAAELEERRLGELQSRAAVIGLDTRDMTPDQIIGRLNRIERTRAQQRQRRERETEARAEADIAEATATEREARAEMIGAEAVPEVEALRRQAREQGIDTGAIEEQAFEEARENPDLNPDTILAERLSDALGVERRYQKETLAQGATDSGINIDPEDQRIEKELTGKSMIQVADWAIQNAPNAFARVIAEKVKARLLAFQRKGMTLDFKIQGGQNRTLNMRGARGVTQFDWGKDDKGTTITVTLNGAAVLNNQAGYPPGTRYSTVLHELLHVATRAQFVFMPNTDPLKKQMIELFNAVADRFNADAKAGNLPPVMMKYYKRMNNVLEDPDEMLAWGLTDRDVQEYFDDIKVGEKSVWSQLVELIRKALGLGKPYESALERLVRTSESLLEVDVNSIDDMLGLRDKQIGGKKKPAGPMVQESLFQKEGKPAAVREEVRYQREAEPEERVKEPKRNILGNPVLGSWTSPTDTKLAGTEFGKDDLIYSLIDKQVDIKRVVQNITETAGRIAAKWNPYLQEELYHGRTARATKEFLQDELRPLIKEIQRNGMTIEEVEKYLHNRHAEDYNKHVAKVNPRNPKMQDGGSGIKTEDARKYLADLPDEKRKVYEDIAKKVDSITKKTRNLVVESGLEGPDTIAAWEKAFPKYVPLMREESDDFDYTTPAFGVGSGFDVRGKFSRAAMGSERKVANILANIAMQREKAIIKSNKNRVAQAVFGLAVQNPNPDFWLAVNPAAEQVPEIALDELRAMGIDEGAIEFLMQEPKQRAIDPKKNEVVNRINATLRKSDNVLAMRINGEDRYVFFNQNDPRAKRAAEALKNLDADQLGPVLGIVSKITRWMASFNTQYNPIFGAYNFLRDVQGAALQLSDTPLRGKQKEVLSGVLPSLKTIYAAMRAERDGKKIDTDMGRLWNEFQEEGGQTGFRDMFSRSQERADALEKEFKQITEGKVKAAGRAVFDWLSDYNDSMENATRLSAYKVAKEKFIKEGMSESEAKQQAASIAKNLTVNFNRKGQIATQAGALYAFFNAAVQGTTRLAQTLRGPAGRKIIAGGLLLGTMQAALLAAAGFDEEEPPEFVRERNIIIPLGGDKYFAFPMPLGYHVIPGLSRIITEWALSGFKDTPDRIASLTGMFLEAFNPIGNAGWSVQTLAPTFADPLVALSENKDRTGKPIARKDFSSMDPTPGYTRARDTASEFSTQIAKFLNYASGGTEFRPGVLSPTPDQIDYLIGQAFGGIGREAVKLEQTIVKGATGEELPPYKIPLVGRFYGETKSSAAESNRFYKNLTLLNEHENEIKGRRDKGQPIGDYLKDNPEARLAPMARKTYKDIQQLRKRREQLVERDAPRESVKAVEEQIKRRMAVFNERVAQLKD